ncbi:MAG: A24 family peptidase [Clostridia bacterium]|nr:A24 family peptidase [Clostridia bacterium]MDD4386258.1 A24 family peptidase [Clostridia bacterium]
MIIGYLIMTILAIVLGQAVSHLNLKMPPVVSEEITYKLFFENLMKDFKFDFKYSFILLIVFGAIMYFLGNIYISYIYAVLVATLMIVFSIDYRFQLIPDEAHIVIIILGIINLFMNINLWYSFIIGMAIGAGIFYGLSLLAVIIFKKEGMGFGDVKLMAALGFLFGIKSILVITLVSFFLGAIIGGLLLLLNKKKVDSYMPFGPFIVIATIIIIFINPNDIIELYIGLCTWLSTAMTDLVYILTNK